MTSRVDWREATGLLAVGRDLFLRTGLLTLFLLLATRAANQLGANAGAAHQAVRQMWMLSAFVLDAYAASAQSLVGYFLGAARRDAARRVARVAMLWGVASGGIVAVALLALEDAVALLLVPPEALPIFAAAWWVFALSQPLNAISFVTDGIHWGAKDYGWLRDGMLCACAVGLALLYAIDVARPSLDLVWGATAVWAAIRAVFGWVRIWPGVGRAPLGRPGERAASFR